MARYRLAFAVSVYFDYGGMQRSMLRIAEACAGRGHEVHVFTGNWDGQQPDYVTVHKVDTSALTNPGKNDALARSLAAELSAGGFDCVVGFTKIPGLDVYYAGDPCYAARVDEHKPWWYRLLPRYRNFIRQERAVFNPDSGTEFLLIAHQERDKFIKYYHSRPEQFHLLPPGINRKRLTEAQISSEDRQQFRDSVGIHEDDNLILLVGSHFRTKGVDRAIKAISSLPRSVLARSKLVIVGGDKQQPYIKLASELGVADHVVFTGARDDMALMYASADLLLHPPYNENTGTILLEAMLFGVPVLATANCGFAHHVRSANAGMVCPYPFKQKTLNHLLSEMLLSSNKLGWRMGGRIYCEKNDLYSLIDSAADIIVDRARRNHEQGDA